MRAVHVVGGGPAGVMAAFAAMREGAPVRIFEKSAFPRHKVCGEFLSPAILPLLRRAGCEAGFLQLRPAVLSAMRLHFGTRVIRHPLPEPAYGLIATNSTVSSSNMPQAQARKVLASTGPPPPRELQLSSPPAAGPSLQLATVFSGSRPTSAASSTTTWNSTSSKIATSESAPSKTTPPTFAVSLRSEASDPSAFTPAVSSGAAPHSPSACPPSPAA